MYLEKKFRPPLSDKGNNFIIVYTNFIMLVEETVIKFSRYICRETAAEYIDKKTARIIKKFVKKPGIGIKKKKK
jgi:hypothetical protein